MCSINLKLINIHQQICNSTKPATFLEELIVQYKHYKMCVQWRDWSTESLNMQKSCSLYKYICRVYSCACEMTMHAGQSVSDKWPQRSKYQLTHSIGQECNTPITGSNLSLGQTDLWSTTQHGGLLSGAMGQTHTHACIAKVRQTPLFSYQ